MLVIWKVILQFFLKLILFIFKINFYWTLAAFQCCISFYCKVNQQMPTRISSFFLFPSHLGHHKALNIVPCAMQWVLISYLFYT